MALIAVDRWGSRKAIPFFDYVFVDVIDTAQSGTRLNAIQNAAAVEQECAKLMCEPEVSWNIQEMWDKISECRQNTNPVFWRSDETIEAFLKLSK